MKVILVATRACNHRSNLEKELQDLGVSYELVFAEENPDIVSRHAIRHSPNIIVDDRVVCRGQPSEGTLKTLLQCGE